jgi:hypothetical protein
MNSLVRLPLQTTPEQSGRLQQLQRVFAEACNALAPLAQQQRCWNRVALHHLAYRMLRERFPELGSQMACNAIYSVSRACRIVYQHPKSPFNVARLGERPLPRLQFAPTAPVYFDRHTLSLRDGQLSMFTLDGRMRFAFDLPAAVEQRLRAGRLREIVLSQRQGRHELAFHVVDSAAEPDAVDHPDCSDGDPNLPEYVLVLDDAPVHDAVGAPALVRRAAHPAESSAPDRQP